MKKRLCQMAEPILFYVSHKHAEKYGKKYNLVFEEKKVVVKNNIFTLRRKK